MSVTAKHVTASIVALLLLGAVLIPCVLYAQNAMDGMHTIMPMESMQQSCCAIQPMPDFHTVLQSTVVQGVYRGILLLVALLVVVVLSRVLRAKTEGLGNFSTMRELVLRQAKIPFSGFERFVHQGIAQPRLYEPAIVLS